MKVTRKGFNIIIKVSLCALVVVYLCLLPALVKPTAQALPINPPVVIFTVTAAAPFSDWLPASPLFPIGYNINGACPDLGSPVPCTLREAVAEANAAAAPVVPPAYAMVTFAGPMPIMIYYGSINVASKVVINGAGWPPIIPPPGPNIVVPNPAVIVPPLPPIPAGIQFPYPLFQITGNNSEIYTTFITGQGAGTNASISDGIVITGNNNFVDLNTILGVSKAAVRISGPPPSGVNNQVSGNWLGIDLVNTCQGNQYGVILDNGAANNIIGRSQAPYNVPQINGNFISCNANHGIFIDSQPGPVMPPVAMTTIDTNWIGTDSTGTVAKPNQLSGIYDRQGLTTLIKGNLVSGNTQDGILMDNSAGAVISTLNLIGTDATGMLALPNGGHGISLINNTVGTMIGTNNVISGNGGNGISMTGSNTAQNMILQNIIGVDTTMVNPLGNVGLPVDLNDDGHTPNDSGDADTGPNALLNYPVITSFTSTTLNGTVCNNCEVHIYQAFKDPAANGGGSIYLSKVTATGTNWNSNMPAGMRLWDLTFLAYDPSTGNTSEFSPRMQLFLPLVSR